jgi:hypothetical protein
VLLSISSLIHSSLSTFKVYGIIKAQDEKHASTPYPAYSIA